MFLSVGVPQVKELGVLIDSGGGSGGSGGATHEHEMKGSAGVLAEKMSLNEPLRPPPVR